LALALKRYRAARICPDIVKSANDKYDLLRDSPLRLAELAQATTLEGIQPNQGLRIILGDDARIDKQAQLGHPVGLHQNPGQHRRVGAAGAADCVAYRCREIPVRSDGGL
jgi:hypothetical protein